jgi:hypothetical protein
MKQTEQACGCTTKCITTRKIVREGQRVGKIKWQARAKGRGEKGQAGAKDKSKAARKRGGKRNRGGKKQNILNICSYHNETYQRRLPRYRWVGLSMMGPFCLGRGRVPHSL